VGKIAHLVRINDLAMPHKVYKKNKSFPLPIISRGKPTNSTIFLKSFLPKHNVVLGIELFLVKAIRYIPNKIIVTQTVQHTV
jgi:hypothetical protein